MKGKRTDLARAPCPIARTLDVIGDWWSLLIVRDALLGKSRFGEFQKSIGLAKNILAARLKKLIEEDILRIEADATTPSVHRYVLTERGRSLSLVIAAMAQWGEAHCFAAGEKAPTIVEKSSARPLAKLELRTAAGRVLDPSALNLRLASGPSPVRSRPGKRRNLG